MKVSTSSSARPSKTPLLIVPVCEGERVSLPTGVNTPSGFTSQFKGKARSTSITFTQSGAAAQVLLIGLGSRAEVDGETLRRCAAIAVRRAESQGVTKAVFWAFGMEDFDLGPKAAGVALSEGAVLGAYTFHQMKSKPEAAKCKALVIQSDDSALKSGVVHGRITAAACAYARDLQNLPGNKLTPTEFAKRARKIARDSSSLTCKVLDESAMAKLGMNLFLSVSQGSSQPAKLVHLIYKPKKKSRGRIALVGKGLTFDAGGVSIKPSARMEEMRYDMSGGAAVLGAFHALAHMDVPYEVHGILGCSENTINGSATKPGDIFTAMNGLTVEVNNTDAEGRLVLADCLTYATKKVRPDTILDLATLTGAVIVGVGHELTGIFPSNDGLRDDLLASGERVGELCWPLPLLPVHIEAMKGQSGDLSNIGPPSLGAGSSQGAAFLSSFVPSDIDWCHLDIAGSAWGTAQRDWVGGSYGSGVGTRLLLDYLSTRG